MNTHFRTDTSPSWAKVLPWPIILRQAIPDCIIHRSLSKPISQVKSKQFRTCTTHEDAISLAGAVHPDLSGGLRHYRVLSWPTHGASIKVVRKSRRHGAERRGHLPELEDFEYLLLYNHPACEDLILFVNLYNIYTP